MTEIKDNKNTLVEQIKKLKEENKYLVEQLNIMQNDLENKQILVDKYYHREQQLRAILNSSKQAYVLMDPGGNIIDFNKLANDNARRLTSKDMQPGHNIMEYALKQYQVKFEENLNKALVGEYIRHEVFLPGLQDESIWFSMCFSPVLNDQGNVCGILFCSLDITEQKGMEIALRDTNEDLHDLIEMIESDVFFARLDSEGSILRSYLSPGIHKTTGYKREFFLNYAENFLKIIHNDDLQSVKEKFMLILQGKEDIVESKFRLVRKDNKIIQVSTKLAVNRFDDSTMQITAILKKLND
ncbi:MAG: PAS domain-containing protein [Candidatus Zixiibacteriota bacterium]